MADIDDFLNRIAQLESSGGENTDHPEVKSGLQKGSTAIGTYGLMPNTIREILNRKRLANQLQPADQELMKMNDDQIREKVSSDPDLEKALAQQLATHVLQRQKGDEDRAAYSWNMGHNLSPQRITDDKLKLNP